MPIGGIGRFSRGKSQKSGSSQTATSSSVQEQQEASNNNGSNIGDIDMEASAPPTDSMWMNFDQPDISDIMVTDAFGGDATEFSYSDNFNLGVDLPQDDVTNDPTMLVVEPSNKAETGRPSAKGISGFSKFKGAIAGGSAKTSQDENSALSPAASVGSRLNNNVATHEHVPKENIYPGHRQGQSGILDGPRASPPQPFSAAAQASSNKNTSDLQELHASAEPRSASRGGIPKLFAQGGPGSNLRHEESANTTAFEGSFERSLDGQRNSSTANAITPKPRALPPSIQDEQARVLPAINREGMAAVESARKTSANHPLRQQVQRSQEARMHTSPQLLQTSIAPTRTPDQGIQNTRAPSATTGSIPTGQRNGGTAKSATYHGNSDVNTPIDGVGPRVIPVPSRPNRTKMASMQAAARPVINGQRTVATSGHRPSNTSPRQPPVTPGPPSVPNSNGTAYHSSKAPSLAPGGPTPTRNQATAESLSDTYVPSTVTPGPKTPPVLRGTDTTANLILGKLVVTPSAGTPHRVVPTATKPSLPNDSDLVSLDSDNSSTKGYLDASVDQPLDRINQGLDAMSFDDLHAQFLSDIRDLEDLQDEVSTHLLNMEGLFASVYSASLQDRARFLDLLEQLENASSSADKMISRFQGPY